MAELMSQPYILILFLYLFSITALALIFYVKHGRLIMESQRKHSEVFTEAVDILVKRLDNFEGEKLTPVLTKAFQQSIEQNISPALIESTRVLNELAAAVVSRQEDGMKELAVSFNDRLTAVTSKWINESAGIVENVNKGLGEIISRMESILTGIDNTRLFQEEAQKQTEAALAEAGKIQRETSEAIRLAMDSVSKAEVIAREMRECTLDFLQDNISRLNLIQKSIIDHTIGFQQKMDSAIGQVSAELIRAIDNYSEFSSGQEKIREKQIEALEIRIGELTERMDHSIHTLGENINKSMKMAMADSVEIIERLAQKTEVLKELYDSYFERVEKQSANTLEEMDFNVQKILAAYANETTLIIDKLVKNSSNALELFEKNINSLVHNTDEHSRSLGLYAKEINMDIADLSKNLRGAVKEFSGQLESGIGETLKDFDKGLAEVAIRLANILESIRESAEALQKAMSSKQ